MFFKFSKVFVYYVLYVLFSLEAFAAAVLPNMWDPGDIETVVRLRLTDNDAGAGYYSADYSGFCVMVETRRRGITRYEYGADPEGWPEGVLWFGNAVFQPFREDDSCHVDRTGVLGRFPSQVSFKYFLHPRYRDARRDYGENVDVFADLPGSYERDSKLKILRQDGNTRTTEDALGRLILRSYFHMDFIKGSFFEWTLPNRLTVKDFIAKIRTLQKRGGATFPEYSRSGFSIRGATVYNCISFSVELIKQLGLLVDYNLHADYLSLGAGAVARTEVRHNNFWYTASGVVGGAAAFAVLGYFLAPFIIPVIVGGGTATAGAATTGTLVAAGTTAGAATAGAATAGTLVAAGTTAGAVTGGTVAIGGAAVGGLAGAGVAYVPAAKFMNKVDDRLVTKGLYEYERHKPDGGSIMRVVKVRYGGREREIILGRNVKEPLKSQISDDPHVIVYELVGVHVL